MALFVSREDRFRCYRRHRAAMTELVDQLSLEASSGLQVQRGEAQTREAKEGFEGASKKAFSTPPPPATAAQPPQSCCQKGAPGVSQSVLDAQLEALALGGTGVGHVLASLVHTATKSKSGSVVETVSSSYLELDTEDLLMFHPRKGPNSLLGTGSSVASSDHEVSSSDFESDSGIETSHPDVPSPDVGVALPKPLQKGVGPYIDVMPHDDLAITSSTTITTSTTIVEGIIQSDSTEKSSDVRIDSFIECLDEKASSLYVKI